MTSHLGRLLLLSGFATVLLAATARRSAPIPFGVCLLRVRPTFVTWVGTRRPPERMSVGGRSIGLVCCPS